MVMKLFQLVFKYKWPKLPLSALGHLNVTVQLENGEVVASDEVEGVARPREVRVLAAPVHRLQHGKQHTEREVVELVERAQAHLKAQGEYVLVDEPLAWFVV